ncbi:Prokaryotic membrane lipoprotein lipid attachment site [Carpediemonas membranifera]|uniref:Autophagy-related protein 27 n=1 Tax=Carpediemonas membranifera TaxID=201153 RepID=A0A8J6AW30_9EUKA|nr:Prokaryotic membrane lipoprotein lipid attachment site [Carpediemonas membranifera]|eukprot:KAG9393935.1 Prokaryotic membrane lipoprotein lipid attachment site [Carpediemonas membranifera]
MRISLIAAVLVLSFVPAVLSSCTYELGGKKWNLDKLHSDTGWYIPDTALVYDYFINFCGPVTVGAPQCSGQGACKQEIAGMQNYYPLGLYSDSQLAPGPTENAEAQFTLIYLNGRAIGATKIAQTHITMFCDKTRKGDPRIEFEGFDEGTTTEVNFFSVYHAACCAETSSTSAVMSFLKNAVAFVAAIIGISLLFSAVLILVVVGVALIGGGVFGGLYFMKGRQGVGYKSLDADEEPFDTNVGGFDTI